MTSPTAPPMPSVAPLPWDEILPHLLPLERRGWGRGGRLLAVFGEGMIVGRARGVPELGEEATLAEAAAAWEPWIRRGRLRVIAREEVSGLEAATIEGEAPRCRLAVTTAGGTWRGIMPTTAESVPLEACSRAWGVALRRGPLRASARRWVGRCLLALLVVAFLVAAGAVVMSREPWLAIGPLALAGLFAWWLRRAWKPRWPSEGGAKARGSRAGRVPEGGFAPSRRRHSRWGGRALRWGGAAVLVAGFYVSDVITTKAMEVMAEKGHSSGAQLLWIVHLLCVAPGVWLIVRGYALSQPDGPSILASDGRPPIVYLRSFGDDESHTFTEQSPYAELCALATPRMVASPSRFSRYINFDGRRGGWGVLALPLRMLALVFGRGADTAEEQLANALRRHGPVVAIGDPREALPTPGAARLYVSHDTWQQTVLELLERASLVIVQPGPTEGVWWEMQTVFARMAPERIVLSWRALEDPDHRDVTLARLRALLARPIPRTILSADLVAFGRDLSPRPIHVPELGALRWPWTGTSADLAKAFEPVFSRLLRPDDPSPAIDRLPPAARRPRRTLAASAQRLVAATLYGVAPLALGLWATFAPVAEQVVGPAWDHRTRPFAGTGYVMPIDTALRVEQSSLAGAPIDLLVIGLGRGIGVWTVPRTAPGGAPLKSLHPDGFRLAARDLLGPMTIRPPSAPFLERRGPWPWVRSTVDAHDPAGGRAFRLWMWGLDLRDRRHIVFALQTLASAPGAMPGEGAWDTVLPAKAMQSIDAFEPIDAAEPAPRAALTGPELRGRHSGLAVRVASGWVAGAAELDPEADVVLLHGDDAALHLRYHDDALADDPMAPAAGILSLLQGDLGHDLQLLGAGWRRIGNDLFLDILLDASSPAEPRQVVEVFFRRRGARGFLYGLLLTLGPEPAARDRLRSEALAMMLASGWPGGG